MTVKEIFELRRQGKIEEAYDAIRPMYAIHKGRYTSLCMFWTAADIFKKRIDEGRTDEAAKIYEALKRVLPYIKDGDTRPDSQPQPADDGIPGLGIDNESHRSTDSAAAFMQSAARRLTVARQLDKQEASKQSEENISAISALSAGQKEEPSPSDKENPSNLSNWPLKEEHEDSSNSSNSSLKEEQEDLSGHLAVSLDEGIIRPIEGLNAIQRVILACVVGHPGYSAMKISESTGIPQTIVDRHIAVLIDSGLIEHREKEPNPSEYFPIDSIS